MKTWLLSAVLAGPALLSAQTPDINFYASHIDLLIGQGKYSEANELLGTRIDSHLALHQEIDAAPYFGLLAKFYIETGLLAEAEKVLKIAEATAARTGIWVGLVTRVQTSLLLETGRYDAAAKAAAKAYRQAGDRNETYLRLSYCQSLEALARLRLGDLDRAEKLTHDTVKDVPHSLKDEELLYGPRVLYTAGLIASHRNNHRQAEEYCQRGVVLTEKHGNASRDLVLGYLALAEVYLSSGDLSKCREFGTKALEQTTKVFRRQHQDVVAALNLLARADLKEGKLTDAEARARESLSLAAAVFGEGSSGAGISAQLLNEVLKAARGK